MATFLHRGLRLHYLSHGGPADGGGPVLLIHGLGSSTEDWLLQIETIAAHRPVAAIDLPGFGRSEGFRHWPTVEEYAAAARELCQLLWPRPAHIVGLSLGGVVGMQLAISYAACVESLVAAGTPLGLRLTTRGWILGAVRLGAALLGRMDWVARLVSRDLFPRPDQSGLREEGERRLARNDRRHYLRAVVALARARRSIEVERIRQPALFIAGGEDRTVPAAGQAALARTIDRARFVEIPGSGHATPVDASEAFNRLVNDFLQEVDSRVMEPDDRRPLPAAA